MCFDYIWKLFQKRDENGIRLGVGNQNQLNSSRPRNEDTVTLENEKLLKDEKTAKITNLKHKITSFHKDVQTSIRNQNEDELKMHLKTLENLWEEYETIELSKNSKNRQRIIKELTKIEYKINSTLEDITKRRRDKSYIWDELCSIEQNLPKIINNPEKMEKEVEKLKKIDTFNDDNIMNKRQELLDNLYQNYKKWEYDVLQNMEHLDSEVNLVTIKLHNNELNNDMISTISKAIEQFHKFQATKSNTVYTRASTSLRNCNIVSQKLTEKLKYLEQVKENVKNISTEVDRLKIGNNQANDQKIAEILQLKQKELNNIPLSSDIDNYNEYKQLTLNKIENLLQKLRDNKNNREEISKEIIEIHKMIDNLTNSSMVVEIANKITNLQYSLTEKFSNQDLIQYFTKKINNCTEMLKSKQDQIKSVEENISKKNYHDELKSTTINTTKMSVEEYGSTEIKGTDNTNTPSSPINTDKRKVREAEIPQYIDSYHKMSKNEHMLNKVEENLNIFEVEVNKYLGSPTDDEYLKLKIKLEENVKILEAMKIEGDNGDAKERSTSLKVKANSILRILQQKSYTVEAIQQLEERLRPIENNVDENIQKLSDYQKEDIEDELYGIKGELEEIPVTNVLHDRKNRCYERIKKMFVKLQEEINPEIPETETILDEIERKFTEIQSLIVRSVSTSHSEAITSLDAKLTDMLSKVKQLNIGDNKELQERRRFLTDNIEENSIILQRNFQKKGSKTDKIEAETNDDEIDSQSSIKKLVNIKSANMDKIERNFEKRSLTDTITENTRILQQLCGDQGVKNRISKTTELIHHKDGQDELSARTKEIDYKTKQIESNRTNRFKESTSEENNTFTSPEEKSLNEVEEQCIGIQNSIKTFIGSSTSEEFQNLNLEMSQILSKLKQLQIGNNNGDLQKKQKILTERIVESISYLTEKATWVENLLTIEKKIVLLKNNPRDIMTDYEKEDFEEQLQANMYTLNRITSDDLQERKNYCLEKIRDFLKLL